MVKISRGQGKNQGKRKNRVGKTVKYTKNLWKRENVSFKRAFIIYGVGRGGGHEGLQFERIFYGCPLQSNPTCFLVNPPPKKKNKQTTGFQKIKMLCPPAHKTFIFVPICFMLHSSIIKQTKKYILRERTRLSCSIFILIKGQSKDNEKANETVGRRSTRFSDQCKLTFLHDPPPPTAFQVSGFKSIFNSHPPPPDCYRTKWLAPSKSL